MTDRLALAHWYFETFVVEASHYALMNPTGHEAKYSRRNQPLTADILMGALNNQTRRTRPNKNTDNWQTVVCTYATVPQTKDGRAKAIILEIDAGGATVAASTLAWLKGQGIWAFAQLSKSDKHDGAHIWIICTEWQPATYLHDIAKRIIAHLKLTADAYPTDSDLRLPLMTHLRAPGGPRRFDILAQDGEIIDTSDPWAALARLQGITQTTTTRQLIDLADKLPSLPIGGGESADASTKRHAVHKSKVVPTNISSVISFYNDNHKLTDLLSDWYSVDDERSTIVCPFHDDHSPSLSIWTVDNKQVCACRSTQSNCPASMGSMAKHWDAFDLYCHKHNLSAKEAVIRLVEEYGLGKKRETVVVTTPAAQPVRTIEDHNRQIADVRRQLAAEMGKAAQYKGHVTSFNVTPGLGKTHTGAQVANMVYSQLPDSEPDTERVWLPDGQFRPHKQVAICAPTKEIATDEWLPRLTNGYVWQSKIELCTCFDKEFLTACIAHGYMMPECVLPDCPYRVQAQSAYNKQIIYQHQHLCIKDGYKFTDTDLLIVDESPLAALLPERHVFPRVIGGFLKRHADDPAIPLLTAILAATKQVGITINDVRGAELLSAIEVNLNGVTLADAIKQAKRSPFNESEPRPPDSVGKMVPQFLYGLLQVLETEPAKLSYGRCDRGEWGLVWHDKRPLALAAYGSMYQPAIIILDGSADETIYKHLCEPWPYTQINISGPISPLVEIVQVNCTPSTRAVVKEQRKLDSLARQVAQVANKLNVTLDGGVTFKDAVETMAGQLGGEWLHYGGQRGKNELANASTIAVVCSPTTPPYAVERKALALWLDMASKWQATGIVGAYQATDERLNAMNRLFTIEELRQAVYRARPLTATIQTKLLVFTPWDLTAIGLQPDQTFTSIEHGNSNEAKAAMAEYAKRAKRSPIADQLQQIGDFQKGIIYSEAPPPIENGKNVAGNTSDSNPPPRQVKVGLAPLDEVISLVECLVTGAKLPKARLTQLQEFYFGLTDRRGREAFNVGPVAALEYLQTIKTGRYQQFGLGSEGSV